MNEEDLRVQRTRRLLREAFIELVESDGYDPITIRQITQKAQVGYKTFFRHYESKEALLQSIVLDLLDAFFEVRLEPTAVNAPQRNTAAMLQIAQENATLLLTIMHSPAAGQLLEPLTQFAAAEGLITFKPTDLPPELVAHHFAHAMLQTIVWWLESDTSYTVEQVAIFIDRLILQPLILMQPSA